MATIVLVVANAASPTAGDLVIQGRLEAAGHTVERTSDEAAEFGGAYDGVFVSDSCAGGTFGSKYDTVAKPGITCENAGWRLGSFLGGINGTDWTVEDVPEANGGLTGAQTVYDTTASQQGVDTDTLPAAATVIARLSGDADHGTYVIYAAGGALTSGTAADKRVFLRIGDPSMDTLAAAGTTLLDAAIAWAFAAPDVAAAAATFSVAAQNATVDTTEGDTSFVRSRLAGSGAASTSHAVTLPGDVETGDRLIVGFVNDDTNADPEVASGWTLVGTVQDQGTTTNHSLSVWTRVATGTDSLTVDLVDDITGDPVSQEAQWVAICMVGDGGAPSSAFAGGGSAATAAVTAITGLASGNYASIIFLGLDNGTAQNPTGVTPPTGWGGAENVTNDTGNPTHVVLAFSMDQSATGVTGFSPANVTWTTAEQWITAHIVVAQGEESTPPPGSAFDLDDWKITLPSGPANDATEVEQPELETYSDEHFFLASGRMVFVAPVQGSTTSGSEGTRSELREMEGGVEAAWSPFDAEPRQLTVTMRVDPTSLTDRMEIICGQIHGAGSSPIPLILSAEWESGGSPVTPRIRIFQDGPGVGSMLSGEIDETTDFTYRIRFEPHPTTPANGGTVEVSAAVGAASNLPASPQFTYDASAFTDQTGWFFKAGAYNKSEVLDGGSGEARVEVTFLELIQPGDDPQVAAQSASVGVVGNNATSKSSIARTPTTATFSVAAQNATVDIEGGVDAEPATLSMAAQNAAVVIAPQAGTASLSVAAQGATTTSGTVAFAEAATVGIAGQNATGVAVTLASAEAATFGVTAHDVDPATPILFFAQPALFGVTANDVADINIRTFVCQDFTTIAQLHAYESAVVVGARSATATPTAHSATAQVEAYAGSAANCGR